MKVRQKVRNGGSKAKRTDLFRGSAGWAGGPLVLGRLHRGSGDHLLGCCIEAGKRKRTQGGRTNGLAVAS